MTARERQVYLMIKKNPMITQEEISKELGISRSAASVHISSLLRQGALRGRGYVVNEAEYDVVAGVASIDILGLIDGEISDSVNEDIENYQGRISVRYGGAAYNIAEYITRLGGSARLLATMSNDIFGQQLRGYCEEIGINVDDCLTMHDDSQAMMLQFRRNMSDHNEHNVGILNHDSSIARLTPEYCHSKNKMLSNARNIILTDILREETVSYLLSIERPQSWLVFSGAISRLELLRPFVGEVDHIYMNLQSALRLAGIESSESYEAGVLRLMKMGVREAFISCNNQYVLHVTQKDWKQYRMINGVKAGSERGKDAFVAGLICTQDSDKSMADRIRYAAACSRLAVSNDFKEDYALSDEAVERLLAAERS